MRHGSLAGVVLAAGLLAVPAAAGMAAMLGGGFEFYLTKKLLMDVEGRWNLCSVPTIEFGTDSATFVSSSVRLGWVFGE